MVHVEMLLSQLFAWEKKKNLITFIEFQKWTLDGKQHIRDHCAVPSVYFWNILFLIQITTSADFDISNVVFKPVVLIFHHCKTNKQIYKQINKQAK